MPWSKLSMADRAKYIKLGVENGVTDLENIRDSYNSYINNSSTEKETFNKFEEGGETNREPIFSPIILDEVIVKEQPWQKDFRTNFGNHKLRKNIIEELSKNRNNPNDYLITDKYNQLRLDNIYIELENDTYDSSHDNEFLNKKELQELSYDDYTHETYNRLARLYNIWNYADRPSIYTGNKVPPLSFLSAKNNNKRAYYIPLLNRINAPYANLNDVVQELAHPIQSKYNNSNNIIEKIKDIPNTILGEMMDDDSYHYDNPNHYEYKTHSIVAPQLYKYIFEGTPIKYIEDYKPFTINPFPGGGENPNIPGVNLNDNTYIKERNIDRPLNKFDKGGYKEGNHWWKSTSNNTSTKSTTTKVDTKPNPYWDNNKKRYIYRNKNNSITEYTAEQYADIMNQSFVNKRKELEKLYSIPMVSKGYHITQNNKGEGNNKDRGAYITQNQIDSISKYAKIAEVPISEALGLAAVESTFNNANGRETGAFYNKKIDNNHWREYYPEDKISYASPVLMTSDWSYINDNPYNDFLSTIRKITNPKEREKRAIDGRVYMENQVKKFNINEPPLLHALKLYKAGKYNTRNPAHTEEVKKRGRNLMTSPEIKLMLKNSSFK